MFNDWDSDDVIVFALIVGAFALMALGIIGAIVTQIVTHGCG